MHSETTTDLLLPRKILESKYTILFIQQILLGSVLSTLHVLKFLILKLALWGWFYY